MAASKDPRHAVALLLLQHIEHTVELLSEVAENPQDAINTIVNDVIQKKSKALESTPPAIIQTPTTTVVHRSTTTPVPVPDSAVRMAHDITMADASAPETPPTAPTPAKPKSPWTSALQETKLSPAQQAKFGALKPDPLTPGKKPRRAKPRVTATPAQQQSTVQVIGPPTASQTPETVIVYDGDSIEDLQKIKERAAKAHANVSKRARVSSGETEEMHEPKKSRVEAAMSSLKLK